MKRIASLLIIAGLLAGPSAALAKPVADLDALTNLTQRVVEKSIWLDIMRVHPLVAPNGTVYEQDTIDYERSRQLFANELHCVSMKQYVDPANTRLCGHAEVH